MVKSEGEQRKSDGVVVPVIGVMNAPVGKGPDFDQARGGGKRKGVAGTARSNHPGGTPPIDNVRKLQRKLWAAAKQSEDRRFHALFDRVHRGNAVWDDDEQRLISDAEVAEIDFTAFTSRRKNEHTPARLIVRRVKRLNPKTMPSGQDTLFAAYRHHAVFTDSPMSILDAETCHRQHAVIEQVNADLKSGALAHLPSGSFAANSAWLVLAAIAFNLTRAAGCLASTFHARATGAPPSDNS